MQKKLTCEQVLALLNFYAEGCLTEILARHVTEHLEECESCRQNYFQIKNIMEKYENIEESNDENIYTSKQYEDFKYNLSAYVDNELDNDDNIKIKKFAISNPYARKDLENIYNFKRVIKNSFERTKNDLKFDFSKDIIKKIKNDNSKLYSQEYFYKLSLIFSAFLLSLIVGIIKYLHLH